MLPPVPRIRSHTGKIFYNINNRHKSKGTEPTKRESGNRVPGAPSGARRRGFSDRAGEVSAAILRWQTEHLGNIFSPTITERFDVLITSYNTPGHAAFPSDIGPCSGD